MECAHCDQLEQLQAEVARLGAIIEAKDRRIQELNGRWEGIDYFQKGDLWAIYVNGSWSIQNAGCEYWTPDGTWTWSSNALEIPHLEDLWGALEQARRAL